MSLIIFIGFVWAVKSGFEESGKGAWNRGAARAKQQKSKASSWWDKQQQSRKSARYAGHGGRAARGLWRGWRHLFGDFKTGAKAGWQERGERTEQVKQRGQQLADARLRDLAKPVQRLKERIEPFPITDRTAELHGARQEADGDAARKFQRQRSAAAELAGRIDHPPEPVPKSQQCSWCDAKGIHGIGTPDQACQAHHDQFDLPSDPPPMTKGTYPANAYAKCANTECEGITPGDQVHTSFGKPVQHAKGNCKPTNEPTREISQKEFEQAMSTTTGEATTYEAACATYAGLEQQAGELAAAIDTAAGSLRSAGCNGNELDVLMNAGDSASAVAAMIQESGKGFQQRQGGVAEAMHAAGGQEAVADHTDFYV